MGFVRTLTAKIYTDTDATVLNRILWAGAARVAGCMSFYILMKRRRFVLQFLSVEYRLVFMRFDLQ